MNTKFYISLFFSIFLSFQSILQAQVLKLATDPWPPYFGDKLLNGGVATEIITTAFKRAGHEAKVSLVPWERALILVKKGEDYDGFASVWYVEDRNSWLALTKPFYTNQIVFLKRKDNPFTFEKLSDLKNHSVGVTRGYVYSKEFNEDPDITKSEESYNLKNIKLVVQKHLDLDLEDKLVATYMINNELPSAKDELSFLPKTLVEKPLYVGISKRVANFEKIILDFNRALDDMKADGTYSAIFEKHQLPSSVN